jgi:hypothetical protein
VAFRLPDGLGWAIAHDGALLRWRTGAGAWVTAGRDAALLPPAATAVQVTLGSAPPTVVTLPAPRGPRR